MKQLKNDQLLKNLMETYDAFVDNDGFDPEEAIKAGINKKKILIKSVLKTTVLI